jgi:hypothetical protein
MNRPKQLTQLIFSYYREDPEPLQQLQLLMKCQVFRRWKVFYIRCHNQETANALTKAYLLLREPIAQLRLAKQIAILVGKTPVAVLPIDTHQIKA